MERVSIYHRIHGAAGWHADDADDTDDHRFISCLADEFYFKRFTLPVILRSDSDEESRPIAQLFSQLYVTEILRHSVPLDDNACGSLQVE